MTIHYRLRPGPSLIATTLLASFSAFAQQADPAAGTIVLETVEVEASKPGQGDPAKTGSYVAEATSAATKTNTPIVEIPQSVSVITRQQMDERDVQTLTEAVTYTPGVEVGVFGFDPRFDSFYVRGFDMTYTGIYRDGLQQPAGNFAIFKTEPYGLQNITIIKGPSSALYGIGSPGGLIDLTTKMPPADPLHEVMFQTGNYNRMQGQFDLGGPIDPDGDRAGLHLAAGCLDLFHHSLRIST